MRKNRSKKEEHYEKLCVYLPKLSCKLLEILQRT